MSFRLRVLLLIVFLVATSTAATAWLTLRQASRQLTDSVAASDRDIALAADELADYGQLHGTWLGIEGPVRTIADRLGQRIRVATETGTVLADSDLLAGHEARPVSGAPTVVDAQPTLPPLAGETSDDRYRLAVAIVDGYHRGWLFAACVTEAGFGVRATVPKLGLPAFEAIDAPDSTVDTCQSRAAGAPRDIGVVAREGRQCAQHTDEAACLQQLFAQQISQFAPEPLRLFVGARDVVAHPLSGGSIAITAVAVLLAAILTAVLLTRRVLRPIGALTAASRRLGSGDLAERVPVTGRDELADLGRAFNRMASSLEQSEERQRRLIADVAHELRTPLANLRGYLEALADGVIAPSSEMFASLHEEALLQQRIVDDLQDLALAEAEALTYHKTVVDAGELAETCRAAHAAVAAAAGITLAVDAGTAAAVVADPDRLRQVLNNLIRNAIAATPPGGTITLAVQRTQSPDRVVIEVCDSGHGIDEEHLPHIFDRFWRADPARHRGTDTAGTGGGGLGLAIARQIVLDHGGTIEAASGPGEGSIFTVALPAAGSRADPPA